MAFFINNPIGIQVQALDKSADNVTFHRVIADVVVGGKTYTHSVPVNKEGASTFVVFDVSSSLRAYAESAIDYAPITDSRDFKPISFGVSFHDEWMQDGRLRKSTERQISRLTAMLGGYTDRERMNPDLSSDTAEKASHTLRPTTSAWVFPAGHDFVMYTAFDATPTLRTAHMTHITNPMYVEVADDGRWVDFQFVNTRGLVESAFARLSAESVKGGSTTHVRSIRESFRQMSHRLTINERPYAQLSCNSGFVDVAWARWWSYEFCKAHHHWIKMDGLWVPCSVQLKDGASVINRTKTELLSVDFDVVLDINGMI